jgi:hypothetical protein
MFFSFVNPMANVDMSAVTSYLEEISGRSQDSETDKVRNLIQSLKLKPQPVQKITIEKKDLEFLVFSC